MTVPGGAPFTVEEYEGRVAAVRERMRARDLEALLLVSPENIYYLVGLSHQGYFAFTMLVFPAEGQPLLVTRSMERVTIIQQAPDVEHVGFGDHEEPAEAVGRALRKLGLASGRVAVEKSTMFFPLGIWEDIQAALPGLTDEPAGGIVDEIRMVKSERELEYVRQAAALSDRSVRAGVAVAGVGVNEREVAAAVYRSMVLGGSEYPGFAPLVRSTEYLRHEHATWRDRVLTPGDSLFMELSASVHRYHAPLTRTVHIGRAPRAARAASEVALEGLEAVRSALRPGVLAGDVYAAWQEVIDGALGHSEYQRHHCGYSVGIGFPPSWVGGSTVVGLRRESQVEIRENMVFHVLSWLLGVRPGDHGVSDTILVTPVGGELLTSASRESVLLA